MRNSEEASVAGAERAKGREKEVRAKGARRSFRVLWATLRALASTWSERRAKESCEQRGFMKSFKF